MRMTAYAVYEASSGQVLHLHVEPSDVGTTPDELRQMVDPTNERRLQVLELARGSLPARPFRIVKGEVREVDEAEAKEFIARGGFGGGEVLSEGRGALKAPRYEQQRRERP